jgi:hypothetical protein
MKGGKITVHSFRGVPILADRINDMIIDNITSDADNDVVLACQDRFIRFIQVSTPLVSQNTNLITRRERSCCTRLQLMDLPKPLKDIPLRNQRERSPQTSK